MMKLKWSAISGLYIYFPPPPPPPSPICLLPSPSPKHQEDKLTTDFDVNRRKAQEFNLDIVLDQVRDHAADRDAWDMADECRYP